MLLNGCVLYHWSIAHFSFVANTTAVLFPLYLCVSHFCFTRVASTLGNKPYNTSPHAS